MGTAPVRPPRPPWTSRVAGAVVALLGVTNAAFGVLSLTTDLVRLDTAAAVGLLALGAVTAAIAVPVWRGSPAGVTAALTVFALLLIVQLGDTASTSEAGSATPRLLVLAGIVVVLAGARLHLRRASRR